ncbi:hypothetical protein KFL_001690220 [Klebsormidium nitens]|uniref:Uncharacterized protein n=1 Tax=Klebsormidium nitens TaxID=105231 RepID=A0A1Y1HZ64_KLENI|nr:hypothetical protein KFL_001690220 [Klebsormidium nitens]|eukprot:GAQ83944.1 hypothetical protein KFL_001690220 [Klebsormidium nitens]
MSSLRCGRLFTSQLVVHQQGWQLLLAEQVVGVSEESGSWVTYVANNQSGTELLGIQARKKDHWPVQRSACRTRCIICDQKAAEGAEAEESRTTRWVHQQRAAAELGEAVWEGLKLRQKDVDFAQEASTPEGSKREAEEVERVRRDLQRRANAEPAVARAVLLAQEFIGEWREFEQRHKEFPCGKVYAAFVASNAAGAACIGQVPDPAQHLPAVRLGGPVSCAICERFQPLEARVAVWREAEALMAARVEHARREKEREEQEAKAAWWRELTERVSEVELVPNRLAEAEEARAAGGRQAGKA